MSDSTVVSLPQPDAVDDPLTAVLRNGSRRLLAQAIEDEADAFLATMKSMQLSDGRDHLIRHDPKCQVQTGIGPVAVQRAKLRDRDAEDAGGGTGGIRASQANLVFVLPQSIPTMTSGSASMAPPYVTRPPHCFTVPCAGAQGCDG